MLDPHSPEALVEENSDVLRRMAADGDNLASVHDIDFHHLFDDKEQAEAFFSAAADEGFDGFDVDYWHEVGAWLATVQVPMIPSLEEITTTERALNAIAVSCGGRPDGWGCMEIAATEAP